MTQLSAIEKPTISANDFYWRTAPNVSGGSGFKGVGTFVYQPISTKFNAKVTVGTLHIPAVKVRGKRVEGRSNRGKSGKNHGF
jgi:hypothetical protein